MKSEHDRIEALVSQALEFKPEERSAFLVGACGGDTSLRDRVETLLRGADDLGVFMDQTVATPGDLLSEGPGTVIGRYKLLQVVGEGGMGVVYMAEQTEPVNRKVALKIIKLGMDTKQVVARFEAERQALALMDHPHIAKVLDAGATESGRPYFVMELVWGVPITEYCDKNRLPMKERLELFIPVCQAIQHAHQKGVIHRDIKPSNVMVTLHDGQAVPKVIDFGIAKATNQKLTEKTLFTNYAQMIGTPAYMSPEQAEMSGLDVDTRTDVYSLGVLLYELLTGTTPFPSKELMSMGYGEMQRVISESEPPKPSTRMSTMQHSDRTVMAKNRSVDVSMMGQAFKGNLDWIVMKSLEKDRTRRYETVNGLVTDVRRHLGNEPVSAAAPTVTYQLIKLYRKHRGHFQTATVVLILLGVAAAFSSWQAYRAMTERNRALAQYELALEQEELAKKAQEVAEQARELARRQKYEALIVELTQIQAGGDPGYRPELFEGIKEALAIGGEDADRVRLRNVAIRALLDPRGLEEKQATYHLEDGELVTSGRLFGKHVAYCYSTGLVRVYDVLEGELLAELVSESESAATDVLRLSDTGMWVVAHHDGQVVVWSSVRDQEQFGISDRHRFEADGRELLLVHCGSDVLVCAGGSDRAWLWDPSLGLPRQIEFPLHLPEPRAPKSGPKFNPASELVATSPGGQLVAILNPPNELVLWDRANDEIVQRLNVGKLIPGERNFLYFNPNGNYFVFHSIGQESSQIFTTRDWAPVPYEVGWFRPPGIGNDFYIAGRVPCERRSLKTGEVIETLPWLGGAIQVADDGEEVFGVNFYQEGDWRVFQDFDRSNLAVSELKVGGHAAKGAAFSPDNRWIATASDDLADSVRVWQPVEWSRQPIETPPNLSRGELPSFSRDGRWMASAYGGEDAIVIWRTSDWRIIEIVTGITYPQEVWFHPSADVLVAGGRNAVMAWSYSAVEEGDSTEIALRTKFEIEVDGWVTNARLSRDLNYAAWVHSHSLMGLMGTLHVATLQGQQPGQPIEESNVYARSSFAFLDERPQILVGRAFQNRVVTQLLDLEEGKIISDASISAYAISRDQFFNPVAAKLRFNGEGKYGLRLFDVDRDSAIAEFEAPVRNLSGPSAWSRDGKYLADPLDDGRVRIYDIHRVREELAKLGLDWED